MLFRSTFGQKSPENAIVELTSLFETKISETPIKEQKNPPISTYLFFFLFGGVEHVEISPNPHLLANDRVEAIVGERRWRWRWRWNPNSRVANGIPNAGSTWAQEYKSGYLANPGAKQGLRELLISNSTKKKSNFRPMLYSIGHDVCNISLQDLHFLLLRSLYSCAAVVPSSANQQTTAPPLQIVHHSSALFSSMPNRPPLISPVSPSPGNLQTASDRRAPAPHLQPFKPPSSTSARTLPIASPSVPHLVPSQLRPPPPPPMPPSYRSGLHDRTSQPEVAGGLPSLNKSSLSAMGLLFHVNNQPGANPPTVLQPPPALSSSFDALDMSRFGSGGGNGMVNLAGSSAATDVVCLSDDDE